jgi:hypothetical protein
MICYFGLPGVAVQGVFFWGRSGDKVGGEATLSKTSLGLCGGLRGCVSASLLEDHRFGCMKVVQLA